MQGVVGKVAWLGLGAATEWLDFTYIVWASLPAEVRKGRRYPKPQHAWAAIYRHWDKVDLAVLMEGLLTNHVEDFLYGKLGKLTGAARRRAYEETGIDGRLVLSRITTSGLEFKPDDKE